MPILIKDLTELNYLIITCHNDMSHIIIMASRRSAGGGGVKVLVPYLGNLTGGHTTPDVTGVHLKGVLFDLSHLGLSCQVTVDMYCFLYVFLVMI